MLSKALIPCSDIVPCFPPGCAVLAVMPAGRCCRFPMGRFLWVVPSLVSYNAPGKAGSARHGVLAFEEQWRGGGSQFDYRTSREAAFRKPSGEGSCTEVWSRTPQRASEWRLLPLSETSTLCGALKQSQISPVLPSPLRSPRCHKASSPLRSSLACFLS